MAQAPTAIRRECFIVLVVWRFVFVLLCLEREV